MRKKKIDSLPIEIKKLNLSDKIKKDIFDKGITSIEELKMLRYSDFQDWSKRSVNLILNEVAPEIDPYESFNGSKRFQELKEKYSKANDSRLIDMIKAEILNIPILEFNIRLSTMLYLKKNNITKLKDLLKCLYNEDGTTNYILSDFDLGKLISLADYFNLPIKNDPRFVLMYDTEKALNFNIEVLGLKLMGIDIRLKENGIKNVGNLLCTSKDELVEMLGVRRAEVVINRIHSYGINFYDEEKKYVDEDGMNKIQELDGLSKIYNV